VAAAAVVAAAVAAAAVAAAAVAAAVVAALAGAGPAAAKPKPPALAFTPSSYDYTQVTTGQMASHIFILANRGKRASGALRLRLAGAAAFSITGNTCSGKSLRPGKSNPQAIISGQSGPWGVAVDASQLYWTNPVAGTIWAANLDGSSPHVLLALQDNPAGVAVGGIPGPFLYWANTDGGSNGTINSANLDGTSASAIVTGQNAPAGVAVGSASLYWANPNGGTVNEANLDGGNPHALFANQNASFGVAVGP